MPRTSRREIAVVAVSVLPQCLLAVFLGHYYDIRVLMEAGYPVSSGLNPYGQYGLRGSSGICSSTGRSPTEVIP